MSALHALTYGTEHIIFPSSGMQLLSAVTQFLGVSILAHCLSRRLASEELSSLRGWKDLTWPRLCILLVFLDSWLYLFTCGILIFGVGLEHGATICSLSIYLCIAFYGISKLFIYCFLIEKVHVVWAPTSNTRRFRSPVYIICVITVTLYAVVAALMFLGRVHYIREDGACVTGVDLYASVPLLSYDLYVSIFLTGMFLWPLVKTGRIDPLLRRVAKRTLIAAMVALATSTANVLVLTLLHGKELGWVCLGSCGADVICNALGLFWVTERSVPHFSPSMRIGNTGFLEVPNTGADGSGKPHSTVRVNAVESFPSFKGISVEEKGYSNPQNESKRESVFSMRHSDESARRPSTVRLHTASRSRSSPSPWSMMSVAGLFYNSQEPQPEEHQLEVSITTQMEVVEDIVNPIFNSRRQDLKSPVLLGGSVR